MIGTRFGSPSATVWGSGSATTVAGTPPATSVAPATAVYGAGAVSSSGPSIMGGSPAVLIGFGALAALVIIRQSLPR